MIIAVVGSGGKTTLIQKLARQYREEGKTVLVTTSTHMFIEEDTLLTEDAATIIRALNETGYVMAGVPEGIKIKALPAHTFEEISGRADVVLVEADGSRHMPLKYPNATEPVIPAQTDRILVVWGPHGLGHPLREVCHRPQLAANCLGVSEDTVITREHVRTLLQCGYLSPLRKRFPAAEITVYPSL